jgi:hypothetical protein
VAAVFAVDLVNRLHESYPSLVVNLEQQALLSVGIRYDVGEEHASLVVDEARLVKAAQQFLRRDDRRCVRSGEGEPPARSPRVDLLRVLPELRGGDEHSQV